MLSHPLGALGQLAVRMDSSSSISSSNISTSSSAIVEEVAVMGRGLQLP